MWLVMKYNVGTARSRVSLSHRGFPPFSSSSKLIYPLFCPGPTTFLFSWVPSIPTANSHLKCSSSNRWINYFSFLATECGIGRRTAAICLGMHTVKVVEDEIYWRQKKGNDELALSRNSAHITSQLARCFIDAMVGPRAWIGGLFSRSGKKRFGSDKFLDCPLNPLQEERLQRLQDRLNVPFDETCLDHQVSLMALWKVAYPNVTLKGLISEQWKDMGWQGPNPSTDFRGCGYISLENLLFFARNYPDSFLRLLFKKNGKRAEWEYPFAVAGINVSFMLIQMLDLNSAKPRCLPGLNFVKVLGEDEEAFDVLYCVAFAMMDAQWLAMKASYMEFNEVLRVTRTQLERELSLEDINSIQDLPAFNLL